MTSLTASRTLVKSPPELWSECSDAASLAKHLGAFGEIRITQLQPETAVAWEGAAARGTVKLEPAGWGTRVVLTVEPAAEPHERPAPAEPEARAEPEAAATVAPASVDRPSLFARILSFLPRRSSARDAAPDPQAEPRPELEPQREPEAEVAPAPPVATAARDTEGPTESALTEALDSLGRAHHRPYSRA